MAFLSTMNIIGSGMLAQHTRLDVISENVTNINTTRTGTDARNAQNEDNAEAAAGAENAENTENTPYRRKIVVMQAETDKNSFRMAMQRAAARTASSAAGSQVYKSADDTSRYDFGGRIAARLAEKSPKLAELQLAKERKKLSNRGYETAGGVRITEITEDESDFPIVYDPTHPDANEQGYVRMPNVTLVKEVTDAMAASQAYNADVTAFSVFKQVVSKGLEIAE